MKNNIIGLLALLFIMFAGALSAQDAKIIDLGIFKKPKNPTQLEVKLRPAQDVENGSYSAGVFTVRVLSKYGVTLNAVPGSSPYGYSFAGPVGNSNGYDYYRFQFSGSVHFVNWERDVQYPILTLQINGRSASNVKVELVTDNDWTYRHNGDYYQELLGQELQRNFYYLPLEFIDFDVAPIDGQHVELNWDLGNTDILDLSEVEVSLDGKDFDVIAKVPAHDETETLEEAYNYVHKNPATVNYYRIRLTDINGQVTYSPVRVVYLDEADMDFAVFPNPTPGPLTIASRNLNKYPAGVSYQVSDISGKVLWSDRVTSDNLEVNLSPLPGGAYFVKLFSDDKQLDKFKVILAKD